MLSRLSFAVLVLVILFVTVKRSKPTEIRQPDRNKPAKEPPAEGGDSVTVQIVQADKPTSPPAKTSMHIDAAASANACDQGDTFWATGSWGRVTNVSSSCWVYPNPYSFAIECDADGLSPRGMSFVLEFHAHLALKELACTNCKHLKAPLPANLVTFAPYAVPAKNADAAGVTPLKAYVVKIGRAACIKGSGTYNHSCVVMVDARVSLTPAIAKLPEVCFVSIGDWGTPNEDMLKVAAMLASLARKKILKFIFSTGDNFYPTGVNTLQDPHWQLTFELPFASQYLQNIRWYICAGNHDQWGLVSQLEYGNDHPRWHFPRRTYGDSIPLYRNPQCGTNESIDLYVLNSAGKSQDKQVDDINDFYEIRQKTIAAARKEGGGGVGRDWRFVINHEPMYSGGMHGQAQRNKRLRERFLPPIMNNKVHAYFNGDDHFLEVHRAAGTDYFVSGAGGGSKRYPTERIPETVWMMPDDISKDISMVGIVLHCLQGGVMLSSLIDETGKVHYVHATHFATSQWPG